VFTLIEDMSKQQVAHEKTDTFRDRVSYSPHLKDRLAAARERGGEAVKAVESELGNIADAESGVVIDLFLSYRAVQAWGDMIRLVERMSPPLAATVMVQEQLALALNRAGDGAQAETVLTRLLEKRGPSSETYSILGRVYKDRWEEASKDSRRHYLARGLLDKAIDAYVRGFEADWRDAYPGINAVTLMELRDQPDPRQQQLLPVVAYAVERRIAAGKPDYWDHATRLELAVLARDEAKAASALANALAVVREPWEPETTARNLRLIREARQQHHTAIPWATQMEEALLERAKA
jgi:tetratricopeptide (TPR) repeat protein